MALNLFKDF